MFEPQHLASVIELSKMGMVGTNFDFPKASQFLTSNQLDPSDFYFNRNNPLTPFCYYRDYLLIDLQAFTSDALESYQVPDMINYGQGRIKRALSRNNYQIFINLIDKRLALYSYIKIFNQLSDTEKYNLFWYIYKRTNMNLAYFSKEFINYIMSFKEWQTAIKPDQQNANTIYLGLPFKTKYFDNCYNWSLDINTAIYQACQLGNVGNVYSGEIHSQAILSSWFMRDRKEITVFPSDIAAIKAVNLPTLEEILVEVDKVNIWKLFHEFAHKLKEEFFLHPRGIHGISHTKRVLFLCILLESLGVNDVDHIRLLAYCAICHDIGRINDNMDPKHGYFSYLKAKKLNLLDHLNLEEQEIIHFIVENHSIDDQQALANLSIYEIESKEKTIYLYKIFKDADALDRIRIFDLNINRLRNPISSQLLLLARQLFYHPAFDPVL